MTNPHADLVELLRQLRGVELLLYSVSNQLHGAQPETARAAYVAHDGVDALIEQLETDAGAPRDIVRREPVEAVLKVLEDAVRTALPPGTPLDRASLRLAARAAVRQVQGLKLDARYAPRATIVQVPTVGPDGSITPPPEAPRELE